MLGNELTGCKEEPISSTHSAWSSSDIGKGHNSCLQKEVKNGSDNNSDNFDSDYTEQFKDLIGGICRVPFSFDWGNLSYYNAMITGVVNPDSDDNIPKVIYHRTFSLVLYMYNVPLSPIIVEHVILNFN